MQLYLSPSNEHHIKLAALLPTPRRYRLSWLPSASLLYLQTLFIGTLYPGLFDEQKAYAIFQAVSFIYSSQLGIGVAMQSSPSSDVRRHSVCSAMVRGPSSDVTRQFCMPRNDTGASSKHETPRRLLQLAFKEANRDHKIEDRDHILFVLWILKN